METSHLHGWIRPGHLPPGGYEPEEGETLDHFCGQWRIFQYRRGHRFTVDDLLLAWFAAHHAPAPNWVADLGSGLSSVALALAWRLPGARFFTLEAQAISLRLAQKSVSFNGVADRFIQGLGDLREVAPFDGMPSFDLVTGSPPYWPLGTRTEAAHPQAVPARLEVRGSIHDYARAARRILAPGGLFACVFPNDQEARARAALQDADLLLIHRQEVLFKEGEPYGLVLLGAHRLEDLPANLRGRMDLPASPSPLVIRRTSGAYHPSMVSFRLSMGFPPGRLD